MMMIMIILRKRPLTGRRTRFEMHEMDDEDKDDDDGGSPFDDDKEFHVRKGKKK